VATLRRAFQEARRQKAYKCGSADKRHRLLARKVLDLADQ
jgi:hypothetical protein